MNGRMVDYNGDRSAQHLKDWAVSLIPKKVNTHRYSSQQAQLPLLSAVVAKFSKSMPGLVRHVVET